jgi:hypothetical protein
MRAFPRNTWIVYGLFAVLLAVVALVGDTLVRSALAGVAGLLLVQRALRAPAELASSQRRHDPVTRDAVSQLLARIREFHAISHRAGMPPGDAAAIERDLNALLDRVIRAARGEPLHADALRR